MKVKFFILAVLFLVVGVSATSSGSNDNDPKLTDDTKVELTSVIQMDSFDPLRPVAKIKAIPGDYMITEVYNMWCGSCTNYVRTPGTNEWCRTCYMLGGGTCWPYTECKIVTPQ